MQEYKIGESRIIATRESLDLAREYGISDMIRMQPGEYTLVDEGDKIEVKGGQLPGFYKEGDILENIVRYIDNEILPKMPEQALPKAELDLHVVEMEYDYKSWGIHEGKAKLQIIANIRGPVQKDEAFYSLTQETETLGLRARGILEATWPISYAEMNHDMTRFRNALKAYYAALEKTESDRYEITVPMNPGLSRILLMKDAFRTAFLDKRAIQEIKRMRETAGKRQESKVLEMPAEFLIAPSDKDIGKYFIVEPREY